MHIKIGMLMQLKLCIFLDQQRDNKESVQNRLAPTGEELDEDNAASVHRYNAFYS